MKQSLSLGMIGPAIAHFLQRYHMVLYSLTVVIGVSVAIFLLNGLIDLSNESEPGEVSTTIFDKQTIDKLESFSSSDATSPGFNMPDGRTNPFVE